MIRTYLKRWWRWLVVLLAVGLFLVWRQSSSGLTVQTAKIALGEIAKTTLASGEVIMPDDQTVRAPLTGRVATVAVREGDEVKSGQALFSYQEEGMLAVLRQAESAYAQAKQARDLLTRSAPTDLQLNAANTALSVAQASRDRAKSTYDANGSDLNKAAYEQADLAYQQARSSQEALQRQAPTATAIAAADAGVTASLASLRQAQSDWNHRSITAPAAGTVVFSADQLGHKLAAGSVVTTGQSVLSVAGNAVLQFRADMDESDVVRLQTGQKVTVTLDAYPGVSFEGQVDRLPVAPITNVSGGTVYQVGIKLGSPPAGLRIGLRGQVSVVLETIKDVVSVPTTALVTKEGSTFVWLVKDGKTTRRDLKLGLESATSAQVINGLVVGDSVVVSTNIRDVEEGSSVTVQP